MAQRKRKVALYSPDAADGCIGDGKYFFSFLKIPSRVKRWSEGECRSYYYGCCSAFHRRWVDMFFFYFFFFYFF
ncbi:hypothetical protein CGRA01v4_07827 [Colletotrichum graminicola]|nr:hypothetical protein CGRA01v4_07827 [Colletotrichum graminicola]